MSRRTDCSDISNQDKESGPDKVYEGVTREKVG